MEKAVKYFVIPLSYATDCCADSGDSQYSNLYLVEILFDVPVRFTSKFIHLSNSAKYA